MPAATIRRIDSRRAGWYVLPIMNASSLCSLAFVATLLPFASACGDDGGSMMCEVAGGPVMGAADMHCGSMVQPTSAMSCDYTPPDASADAGADAGDAGAGDAGAEEDEYGPTMYGTEGDDDDCKYHVSWSSSPICQGTDVTFMVTATHKDGGGPLMNSHPELEIFLDETHPAPNTDVVATETSPGSYTVGPVQFDASGRWTVRFHFNDECSDIPEDSPHGHAAFFVDVP